MKDQYIRELIGLELINEEFMSKPIYHLGNKSLQPNIFNIVHNLHVKHAVENLLKLLGAKYSYFTKLITLPEEYDMNFKEIHGTLQIKRVQYNPEYEKSHPK